MRLVQTTFLEDQRIEQRLVRAKNKPTLAFTGDGRLVIAWRRPAPWDWVNGAFVGDHDEPEDELHVHGEPS